MMSFVEAEARSSENDRVVAEEPERPGMGPKVKTIFHAIVFFTCAIFVAAQIETGQITGTVLDQSDAVIAASPSPPYPDGEDDARERVRFHQSPAGAI